MGTNTDDIVTPVSGRLDVPGGTVAYQRAGVGRPTVFLHAAGGAGDWTPFHETLSLGRDLVVPEHPGFGSSDDFPDLTTIDDLVYHYLEVLDRLDLHEVDLIGASFGGWIAAELAVHSPHRVRRLALLAPIGLRVPGASIADLFIMTPPQLVGALFHDQATVETILATEPTVEAILTSYRELGTLGRFGWRPFLCNPRLDGRLHRITSPTLVVAAGEDRIVPIEHCRRYAEQIAGAELIVIDEIGHALYGERPDDVARPIVDFLDA